MHSNVLVLQCLPLSYGFDWSMKCSLELDQGVHMSLFSRGEGGVYWWRDRYLTLLNIDFAQIPCIVVRYRIKQFSPITPLGKEHTPSIEQKLENKY